jgi:hypothetical protein
MKKEDLNADPQSMDNRRLSSIARNPNHPMHTHAKAELDRRKMKNEGAMKRIATTQSNKADRMASGGKKGLETFKKRETQKEAVRRKGAPKMTGDSIAIQRAKDAELNKALGRTKTGRKKPERTMTSTQKSLASMQKETKGAPKGYHFTRDGKLRKGDAGADGDGGAKLRSDPLDKQRSKIPPLPEAYNEPQGQAKRMMSPLQKVRMDKEKADRDRDGKLMNVKTKTKTEATMKSFSEISRSKLGSYAKAAKKDIDKQRNTVKGALDQPASPKHAKAGMDAMKKLHKRSRGSDMYVNKMTGRSKVKPTAEETVNELDKKTLGSYIKKAGPDAVKQTAQAKRHSDAGDMADKDRDMYKHYAKSQRAMDKAKNRQRGIGKAVDKLTKEATIPESKRVDEISDKMKDRYVQRSVTDYGHSNAVRQDAESRGDKDLAVKMKSRMKKRNQGMTRAFGGQEDTMRVAKVSEADRENIMKISKMLDREKK